MKGGVEVYGKGEGDTNRQWGWGGEAEVGNPGANWGGGGGGIGAINGVPKELMVNEGPPVCSLKH